MKKTAIVLIILTSISITIYIVSNFIHQNKNDQQFICDCRNSKTIYGSLFLELYYNSGLIRDMKIKLNQKDISMDPTKIRGNKQPYLYEYDRAFGVGDTITISIAGKKYVISEFKADTIITNPKKGLECRLKSARINKVIQYGNRYKLL